MERPQPRRRVPRRVPFPAAAKPPAEKLAATQPAVEEVASAKPPAEQSMESILAGVDGSLRIIPQLEPPSEPDPTCEAEIKVSPFSVSAREVDGETFDVVIAGLGTSGSALALRLAEAGYSVLVLESGRDDVRLPQILPCPELPDPYPNHRTNPWRTLSRVGPLATIGENLRKGFNVFQFLALNNEVDQEGVYQPKGSTWAGSSGHNAGVWKATSSWIWDQIAAQGNPLWAFERLIPSIKRTENRIQTKPTGEPYFSTSVPEGIIGQIAPDQGVNGRVHILYPDLEDPYAAALKAAAAIPGVYPGAPQGFPANVDFTWAQTDQGIATTPESAYDQYGTRFEAINPYHDGQARLPRTYALIDSACVPPRYQRESAATAYIYPAEETVQNSNGLQLEQHYSAPDPFGPFDCECSGSGRHGKKDDKRHDDKKDGKDHKRHDDKKDGKDHKRHDDKKDDKDHKRHDDKKDDKDHKKRPLRLKIVSEALVTRVLLDKDGCRARGLEFLKGYNIYRAGRQMNTNSAGLGGTPNDAYHNAKEAKKKGSFKVYAKYEVVLCAGVFNTPQILLVSGIGPAKQLKKHGIEVVHNLPGVGRHLVDHQEWDIVWTYPELNPFIVLAGQGQAPQGGQMTLNFKSTADQPHHDFHSHIFSGGPPTGFSAIGDVLQAVVPSEPLTVCGSSGVPGNSLWDAPPRYMYPDGQIFLPPLSVLHTGAALIEKLANVRSEGWVELRSADPTDVVKIVMNYWSHPQDLEDAVIAFRDTIAPLIQNLASSGFFGEWIRPAPCEFLTSGTVLLPDKSNFNPEALKTFIRSRTWSHHGSGTCKMGPKSDRKAVIDQRLRVHGVSNLRVVDCSIFPIIPNSNTQYPAYIAGERASELILEDLPRL